MSIVRLGRLKKNFTKISNLVVTDNSLSSDSFRVFVYLSSLADMDDWNVNNRDFMNKTGLSETRLAKSWKQLIEVGYVERERNRNAGVFRGYNYILHSYIRTDKPLNDSSTTVATKNKSQESTLTSIQEKALSAPTQPRSATKPTSMKEVEAFMNNDQTCVGKIAENDRAELSQKFYNYYEGIGWVINGNPIHSWESVCVTWAINEEKRVKTNNNGDFKTATEKRAEACHNYSHVEPIIPPEASILDKPISASVFLPEGEDW
ncbi:MAG: hypothetical protein HAW67_04635 [Endozoicomonadaceae bacterium]|nr:hypothetical protein [Endozoicomonadaceae bacterium]